MLTLPRPLRHKLEYAGFRTAETLFRSLTVERASALSGAMWRAVAPKLSRHARALTHLSRAMPELTEARRIEIALEMWEVLGRVFGESFHLAEITQDRFQLADEPFWRTQVARARGRGFVVCAPHLANWEIAASAMTRIGLRPSGVYQHITNPLVDQHVRDMRAPLYPGGLFAKETGTARSLLRHIRDGGSVAILADLRDRTGVRVPFFGEQVLSTKFPALLARTLDVPLLVGHVTRLPDVHFNGVIERIEVPRTRDAEADIVAATAAIQKKFEDWIRAEPGQWMWAHKRWD